jgi:hypothetical protein
VNNIVALIFTVSKEITNELEAAQQQHHCTRDELMSDALRVYLDFSESLRRIQATDLQAEQ